MIGNEKDGETGDGCLMMEKQGTQEDNRFWSMITWREENMLAFRNTDFDVLGKRSGQTVPKAVGNVEFKFN